MSPTVVDVNPGTGPIEGADETNALANILLFLEDCKIEGVSWLRDPSKDHDGRFTFVIYHPTRGCCDVVDMPGLPQEQVRYMGSLGHAVHGFPRLYLNGASFLWELAADLVRETFELDEG